jgi:uncharacterized OB-fold protein
MSTRYLPSELTEWNRPFFTAGRLTIQYCTDCAAYQHPPLDFCRSCQGEGLEYRGSAGMGTVDNYSVVHHAGNPRLKESLPYNVVLVEPADAPGVLVLGNVVDQDWPERLRIGASVRCVFAEVADPGTGELLRLPQWAFTDGPEPAPGFTDVDRRRSAH